jgi:uncharacterized protein (DUF305 family)
MMRELFGHPAFLLVILFLPVVGCGVDEHPTEAYLDRDGPLRRSDTLAHVMVRMVERMEELPLTGDRDVNIARELIVHREATIEMNEVLIIESDNDRLKAFAMELSAEHEEEIAYWQEFLDHHPPVPDTRRRGPPDAMRDLDTLEPTDDIDKAYSEIMEMHLRDGIAKMRTQVHRGSHDDIKDKTEAMIERSEARLRELAALQ